VIGSTMTVSNPSYSRVQVGVLVLVLLSCQGGAFAAPKLIQLVGMEGKPSFQAEESGASGARGTRASSGRWVLWVKVRATENVGNIRRAMLAVWQPFGGYETKADCEKAAKDTGTIRETLQAQDEFEDLKMVVFTRCLPELVDPRK